MANQRQLAHLVQQVQFGGAVLPSFPLEVVQRTFHRI
jgi:hypothetical protein